MNCRLCGHSLFKDSIYDHAACVNEHSNRRYNGMCTACGLKKAVPDDDWCRQCNDSSQTLYRNYPGGTA